MPAIVFLIFLAASVFGQEVDFLLSRKHALEERLHLIASERKELRYQTFIFNLDETTQPILGGLVDAAKRGVRVKVIIDDFTDGITRDSHLLQALRDLGVDVRIYNPRFRRPFSFNNRNHMKALIGKAKMIIGGRNTKKDYFKDFIDTEAVVQGEQVSKASKDFDRVYRSKKVMMPTASNNADEVAKAKERLLGYADEFRATVAVPRKFTTRMEKVDRLTYHSDHYDMYTKRKHGINKEIIKMIDNSKETLDLMSPYAYLTTTEQNAIERAIKRGVRVRILSNSTAARGAYETSGIVAVAWDVRKIELEALGIEIYESDRYVHGKTIIKDSKDVFMGSFNLNPRSQNQDLENGIFFRSKKKAKQLNRHQERIIKFFSKRSAPKVNDGAHILQKGGECIQEGVQMLMTEIMYSFL